MVDLASKTGDRAKPMWLRALKVSTNWLVIWALPLGLTGIFLGPDHTIFREGIFFSKSRRRHFRRRLCGAPLCLAASGRALSWLTAPQMLERALSGRDHNPVPLSWFLQFVGFLGAWNHPGNLPPLVSATLGALVTTWTTFVPCFLWVFLGAPYIENCAT